MYLFLPCVLDYYRRQPVLWNGMMDTIAEGLEHGMRWVKRRLHHCNSCVRRPNVGGFR